MPPSLPRWLPLLTVALVAVACTVPTEPKPSDPLPPEPPTPKRARMSFQLDTDSPLFDVASQAASEWSRALGIPVTVAPDGEVPIIYTEQLTGCIDPVNQPIGAKVGACSVGVGTPDRRIEVPTYLPRTHWLTALLHEMGHMLRDRGDHIDDPAALLYGGAVANGTGITPADVTFVCQQVACP